MMHSPKMYSGPALNMPRAVPYGYPDARSPTGEPSSKILRSILYNFAHSSSYLTNGSSPVERNSFLNNGSPPVERSSYLNNSTPPAERRDGRDRRDSRDSICDSRDTRDRDRSSSRDREYESSHRSRANSPQDRGYRPERMSPPELYPLQRMSGFPSPQPRSPYESPQMLPRYYPTPSATVTSQGRSREMTQSYPESYMSPRNRSSSIGSAGSSFRDSRSPSHDSTASRDSASRCSPMSITSSPSPSPPTQDTSKLLGILKGGAYNSPYGQLSSRNNEPSHYGRHPSSNNEPSHYGRPPSSNNEPSHYGRPPSSNNEPTHYGRPPSSSSNRSHTSAYAASDRASTFDAPAQPRRPASPRSVSHSPVATSYRSEKRDIHQCQDEPIDLSCKPKRQRVDSVDGRPQGSPSVDSGWGSDYNTSSVNDDNRNSLQDESPRRSILESILCGRVSSASRERSMSSSSSPIPKPGTPVRSEYGFLKGEAPSPYHEVSSPLTGMTPPESPGSVRSLHTSRASSPVPPSPIPSISSQASMMSTRTRCPWRQTVTLAKKNLLPVSARVSDWLLKIVNFAKSQAEFSGLPDSDKVTLMQHCWTRLMLLYMAETNFQFAVTPVHEDMDDGRPPAISGLDPSEPTMDSVELVQNFIKKCQTLQLDSEEFKCLRMYTLFHTGCSGLENAGFVENISSGTRQNLQDHIRRCHPEDRLRYSNLLLYLHSLFGVNCGMVQTLFCKHLSRHTEVEQRIKEMVLKREPGNVESEEDNETDKDILLCK